MPQETACQIWYPFICTSRDERNSWCIKKNHRCELRYCWASGTNVLSCGKQITYLPSSNKLILHGQYQYSISDSKPRRYMHCVTIYVQHEYGSVQIMSRSMLMSRSFAQNQRRFWDISWHIRHSVDWHDNWRTGKHLEGNKFSDRTAYDPTAKDSNPGTSRNKS
jgi:hypothetical protein